MKKKVGVVEYHMIEQDSLMATQRRNPLTGEWIIVSPDRLKRPWDGEKAAAGQGFAKVSSYLSPGAQRSSGPVNPNYTSTFTFPNDFPALTRPYSDTPSDDLSQEDSEAGVSGLFQSRPARGECHVMCFTPHSELSLPLMAVEDIKEVVEEWIKLSVELDHNVYVQIFENKGAMVGCSNSHPHCQVFGTDFLPYIIGLEDTHQKEFYQTHSAPLLHTYLQEELVSRTRVVEEGSYWVALVPYWATWPFEMILIPKRRISKLKEMTEDETVDLAATMKRYLTRYDNLFECSFPYSMGWHEAPNTGEDPSHWQLHAHYYPPLLRSATVKKHIAGFELLGQLQRDLTPEEAASRLSKCDPDIHFTKRG